MYICRGRFTVKLMELKFKSSSRAWAPSRTNRLFRKLIKLEYTLLTEIGKVVLECFNNTNMKLQIPALGMCEVYLVLSSLNVFIDEQRENSDKKIVEYEMKVIKMSNEICRN
jgi:hypothetical protein